MTEPPKRNDFILDQPRYTYPIRDINANYYPLEVRDIHSGRTCYVSIIDGKMTCDGDLPVDEAAKIFMESMAGGVQGHMNLVDEVNRLRAEVSALKSENEGITARYREVCRGFAQPCSG